MERDHDLDPEGPSDSARRLRVLARSIGQTRYPVLVSGEIGVGKMRFAKLLHALGARRDAPFRRLQCGDVGASLDAAWTDVAAGGTLVLEHLEDAPKELQRAIARALATLAGPASAVRVLATTRRDLAVEVLEGRLVADLYFRLRVLCADLPPLRERREDVPVLARSLLEEISNARCGDPPELTADALELAVRYRWPGNVRQLRNELARVAAKGGRTIGRALLAEGLDERLPLQSVREPTCDPDFRAQMSNFERDVLARALRSAQGNRHRAAAMLGITRRTLQRKLAAARRAGIDVEDAHPSRARSGFERVAGFAAGGDDPLELTRLRAG